MKLYEAPPDRSKRQLKARGMGRRFYSPKDMAIIKHDEAVDNAQVKRGEKKRKKRDKIAVCGCGATGCFIHHTYDPRIDWQTGQVTSH